MNKCSLCQSEDITNIFEQTSCNFDVSPLSEKIVVSYCNQCHHIFNKMNEGEILNLMKHYEFEYSPVGLNVIANAGYSPGSLNSYSIRMYDTMYAIFPEGLSKNVKILDVGCAAGGFLLYLRDKGFTNLYGIDFSDSYSKIFENEKTIQYTKANVYSLPFESESFDVICLDQVLEHLDNPCFAIQEIERVLKKDGYICIGVPDANQYKQHLFFEYYWFLLREHIQHYSMQTLVHTFGKYNFFLQKYHSENCPMSGTTYMPNLLLRFQKGVEKNNYAKIALSTCKQEDIRSYLEGSHAKFLEHVALINGLCITNEQICVWGIGREFLFLLRNTKMLSHPNLILIDGNKYKQQNFTVVGKKIYDPKDILDDLKQDSTLIITAISHTIAIKAELQKTNFLGRVLEL